MGVAPPKSYFIESILVTICCCLPFGIAAIVNAVKVDGLAKRGDWQGAADASNKAKMFVIIAIVSGIATIALWWVFIWPSFKVSFDKALEEAKMEQRRQQPIPEPTFPSQ